LNKALAGQISASLGQWSRVPERVHRRDGARYKGDKRSVSSGGDTPT
jgi:hypothetical protein